MFAVSFQEDNFLSRESHDFHQGRVAVAPSTSSLRFTFCVTTRAVAVFLDARFPRVGSPAGAVTKPGGTRKGPRVGPYPQSASQLLYVRETDVLSAWL